MTGMLVIALAFACDRTLSGREREQWAPVAACLLGALPADESTTAAMLSEATKCLEAPAVVRVLVSATWCVHGDGGTLLKKPPFQPDTLGLDIGRHYGPRGEDPRTRS
jgi:hypothetical protein